MSGTMENALNLIYGWCVLFGLCQTTEIVPIDVLHLEVVELMSGFETSSHRLEQIRVGFSVSISGLAELFAVNRTTIYGWLKGEHKIVGSQLILLERLERICVRWQAQPGYFSGLVMPLHQRVASQTVLMGLRNAPLDDVERALAMALTGAARSFERNRNVRSADLFA